MALTSLPILLTAGLLASLIALCWGGRRAGQGRRAFVEVHPRSRAFLRRQGLIEARHFLDLPGVVVSGHPDRSVARISLGDGAETMYAFLKRETRVSWRVRLAGAAAGFGFVSRSLREARILEALRREGVGCPEWLAAGEDEHGRAFLLVRETSGATELRTWLTRQPEPAARRRLARLLGLALARMHAAGFSHPDLYSKHVLVGADGETVQFLDWQRCRRRVALGARRRARDLAALHATLTDDLADPRERLVCLRAYFAGVSVGGAPKPWRGFLRQVLFHAGRALRRRHVREKRQPPLTWGVVQQWRKLDGDALCVAPALAAAWPGRSPEWLALDRQAETPGPAATRRWVTTANGAPALLVRRRRFSIGGDLWRRLGGRPPASPEQRHAELLLRLQRHAVPAPAVLAMGRRAAPGGIDSFLLTQPAGGAVYLTAWLARESQPPETSPCLARRRRLLREAGALLHRLHGAACYLDGRAAEALAVRVPPGEAPTPLLAGVERIAALRRPNDGRARRDLSALQRALAAAGCGRTDRLRFLAGYRQSLLGEAPATSISARRPGYRTADLPAPQGDRRMSVSPPLRVAAPSAGPRPTVESLWGRLCRGARCLRQRPDWARFAGPDWADRVMNTPVTDRFSAKQGRSTGRWVLDAAGPGARRLTVYLKRHYRLAWWQGLLASLWPRAGWSPAFQEWEHLEWARGIGVPVPEVVAAAEFVGPWGRLRSCLAVEELTDMLPLNEAVPLAAARLAPAAFRRWKCGLIAEMARLTRLLHDRCRFHKDLYLCHFYAARADTAVADPEWRGRLFLIDLHRLGRHPWTWAWWRMKDLAQLLYSSDVPGVDARDRLYFWRMYRGPGPRRPADRWLERMVLFKWGRYRKHNARQKARARS